MFYCIAKAAQRQRELEASSSSTVNPNNKRPLASARPGQPPQSTSATSSSKLARDSRLGTYFEYDLSKMVNSKGGFLVDDGGNVDEDLRRKEKEREIQRNVHNLDLRECHCLFSAIFPDPFLPSAMFLDPTLNPKCKECQSMDIDPTFLTGFNCLVCKKCQNEKPEKYSLLTKTECKLVCFSCFPRYGV